MRTTGCCTVILGMLLLFSAVGRQSSAETKTPAARACIEEALQLYRHLSTEQPGWVPVAEPGRRRPAIEPAQCIQALLRSWDRDPMADAFAKWRLLQETPAWSTGVMDDLVLRRVMLQMPRLVDAPAVPRLRQGADAVLTVVHQQAVVVGRSPVVGRATVANAPKVRVLTTGMRFEVSGTQVEIRRTILGNIASEFKRLRVSMERVNTPILGARRALIGHLPVGSYLRLAAMIEQVDAEMRAGVDDYDQLQTQLLQEAQRHGAGRVAVLTARQRRALVARAGQLPVTARRYVKSVTVDADQLSVNYYTVGWASGRRELLLGRLGGKLPVTTQPAGVGPADGAADSDSALRGRRDGGQ